MTGPTIRWLLLALLALFAHWATAWGAATFLVVDRCGSAEAVFVLAGAGALQERAAHAASLSHSGRFLLPNDGLKSAYSPRHGRNLSTAEWSREALIRAGVDAARIELLPPIVAGTADEAALLSEVVRARDFGSVALVSSPYHTRRIERTFGRALPPGTVLRVCPVPFARTASPPPSRWWAHPRGWNDVVIEWGKLLGYELQGR